MALVFFGPRKLPQLSRSLGKGLAEFRKASDDFKTTWAREVSLEEANSASSVDPLTRIQNSILSEENQDQPLQLPSIEAVAADRVVPRQPKQPADMATSESAAEQVAEQPEPSRKRDWL